MILGYPQEWATYGEFEAGRNLAEYRITVRRVQIPILKPTTRKQLTEQGIHTEDSFWSPHCFYGVISNTNETGEVPLKQIEGVSGGPVIAVFNRREYVVGIQSAWLAKALTVKVVAMDSVKYVFTKYRKWRAKQLADPRTNSKPTAPKAKKKRGSAAGSPRAGKQRLTPRRGLRTLDVPDPRR